MKKLSILLLAASLHTLSTFAQDKKDPKAEPAQPQREVFMFVEQMPEAGYDVNQYLSKNIKYPKDARQQNIEGRVAVSFLVTETGELEDIKVARSVFPSIDSEAVRVIKAMPKWKPGKQNGQAVTVKFTLPITFKLEDMQQEYPAKK